MFNIMMLSICDFLLCGFSLSLYITTRCLGSKIMFELNVVLMLRMLEKVISF